MDIFNLEKLLEQPTIWDSLLINRRKPETVRLFTQVGDRRICLHRFSAAEESEVVWHPHPWPATFLILDGGYELFLATSKDRKSPPDESTLTRRYVGPGDNYEMLSPLDWHKIVPTQTTYTVMINGPEWRDDLMHKDVRRTSGKGLEKMDRFDVISLLIRFKELWQRVTQSVPEWCNMYDLGVLK